MMSLSQFSIAIGAPVKWVQNAHAVLGLKGRYTVSRARRFAMVRVLEHSVGLPLKLAYRLARGISAGTGDWRMTSADGAVMLTVDLDRFTTTFAANLSRALVGYVERRRGRRLARRHRGVAAARERGVDVTLLRESLRRTSAERLRRLDEDVAFVQSLTVAKP